MSERKTQDLPMNHKRARQSEGEDSGEQAPKRRVSAVSNNVEKKNFKDEKKVVEGGEQHKIQGARIPGEQQKPLGNDQSKIKEAKKKARKPKNTERTPEKHKKDDEPDTQNQATDHTAEMNPVVPYQVQRGGLQQGSVAGPMQLLQGGNRVLDQARVEPRDLMLFSLELVAQSLEAMGRALKEAAVRSRRGL